MNRWSKSLLNRLHRITKYRLFIPVQRSKHPPEYTARGIAIGVWWAFTPLVGIQMPCTFITWLLLRRWANMDFNLMIALAWNWVSNVLTMIPAYYGFHLTGQIMLGRWNDLSGYGAFSKLIIESFQPDVDVWDSFIQSFQIIIQEQGLAMIIGCLPWACSLAWLSYVWSLKYLRTRHGMRLQRFRKFIKRTDE